MNINTEAMRNFACQLSATEAFLAVEGLDEETVVVPPKRLEPLGFKQQSDDRLRGLMKMFDSMPDGPSEVVQIDHPKTP